MLKMICVFFGSSVGFRISEWQVSPEESGAKLLRFLQLKLGPVYSARALKRALEQNLCTINGRTEHFGATLVGRGDRVRFIGDLENVVNEKQSATSVVSLPKILFEDDDFLLIDKLAGVSSEASALLEVLKAHGRRPQLALAHRLDKETSGVLAFTKTMRAKEALFHLFKERKVFKSYFALVDGLPASSQGHIENHLGKIAGYQGQSLWGAVPKEKGAIAITEWKLVKKGKTATLLNCFPLTGRTHQIRVHLASIGHAILGDKQYGKVMRSPHRPRRCLLHAATLAFVHPFKGEILRVESPMPDEFRGYLL